MKAEVPLVERSLFDYTDYRVYLKDYYQGRKNRQTGWGLQTWAARLDLKSKSTLAMILNGQRHPSRSLTESLVTYFEFRSDEAEYFSDLVEWKKSSEGGRISTLLMERLAKKRKNGQFQFLDYDRFQVVSEWYFPVLRELFHVRGFTVDADWIAHQLRGRLTAREVKQALQLLLRVGLLKKKGRNIELADADVTTDSDIANEGVRRFHRQMLALASESLSETPVEEREILASTFVVQQKDMPRAKELLRNVANELGDSLESKNGDQVYQLQICFFPVTRKRGDQ